MSQRVIGQERLRMDQASRSGATLERLSSLNDWQPIAVLLSPLYPSAKGEPAWPPLSMFKALLLAVWHDLSDVKLAEAQEDRASFRQFCGFAAHEATPERTAFVRFRRALIADGLDRRLFEAITVQLKARAITVKTGTLVDATIIASASKEDDEARWVKHRSRASVHGFKAHVGADAETARVEAVSVTAVNVQDGREGPAALPDDPGDVFAGDRRSAAGHSAYRGQHFAQAVRARGGVPRVAATAMWRQDEAETLARLDAWNAPIQRVRARIEKIFGTWKRCYGLRRMRWRGLARARAQVHFTATAYNLKRSLNLQPA
jgi:IS5 family transposase